MTSVKVFVTPFAVLAVIFSMILPAVVHGIVDADGPIGDGSADDPFMIHDVNELSMVGKGNGTDPGYDQWTLDRNYRLANDIIFGPDDDTNEGMMMDLTVIYDGLKDEFSLELIPSSGTVTSLYVWIGMESSVSYLPDLNKAVISAPVYPGTYTMTIGGELDDGTFAYAFEIDTASLNSGTVMSTEFNSNGNFDPIGKDDTEPFQGTFDGNGYSISGMDIAIFSDSNVYAGMFGYLDAATVVRLGVTNGHSVAATTFERAGAGGITGYVSSGSNVSDCYNTGSVTATAATPSSVISQYVDAGGITGETESSIIGCYNTGNVTATSTNGGAYAGGIASYLAVYPEYIEKCYNAGNVTATSSSASPNVSANAGGITSSTESEIRNCYNIGNITATSAGPNTLTYAGGIASNATNTVADIKNCYSIGNIAVTTESPSVPSGAGGVIGTIGNSDIVNSYFLIGSASYLVGDDDQNIGTNSGPRTSEWMRNRNNYVWDFDTIWGIDQDLNGGFPVLEAFVFELVLKTSGGGNVTGPSKIYGGDDVVVTIMPDEGHRIGSVTDNGEDVTAKVSGEIYIITNVSGDHTILVEFEYILIPGPDAPSDEGAFCPWLLILILIISIEICLAYLIGIRRGRDR